MRAHYEADVAEFPRGQAYRVKGCGAVAWCILGWETVPDEDTVWSGYEARTGRVVACMIGDDRLTPLDREDLMAIEEDEFCGSCGQIGCGWGAH
jgi:hypothetical protein